jgi:hypothetical protein
MEVTYHATREPPSTPCLLTQTLFYLSTRHTPTTHRKRSCNKTAAQPVLSPVAMPPPTPPSNTCSSYSHSFPFKSTWSLNTLLSPRMRQRVFGRRWKAECLQPFRKISLRSPAISPLLYQAAVGLACSPEDLPLLATEISTTEKRGGQMGA